MPDRRKPRRLSLPPHGDEQTPPRRPTVVDDPSTGRRGKQKRAGNAGLPRYSAARGRGSGRRSAHRWYSRWSRAWSSCSPNGFRNAAANHLSLTSRRTSPQARHRSPIGSPQPRATPIPRYPPRRFGQAPTAQRPDPPPVAAPLLARLYPKRSATFVTPATMRTFRSALNARCFS